MRIIYVAASGNTEGKRVNLQSSFGRNVTTALRINPERFEAICRSRREIVRGSSSFFPSWKTLDTFACSHGDQHRLLEKKKKNMVRIKAPFAAEIRQRKPDMYRQIGSLHVGAFVRTNAW